MNKFSFYLALALLIIGGTYTKAEGVDKTSLITNAGFESKNIVQLTTTSNGGIWQPEGWTVDWQIADDPANTWDQAIVSSGKNGKNEDLGFTATEGEQFFYSRMRWLPSTLTVSQTLKELPKGSYTLSCMIIAPEGGAYPTSIYATTSIKKTATETTCEDWQQITVDFDVLSEKGDVTIGAMIDHFDTGNQGRIFLDDFQLTYNGEPDESGAIQELQQNLQNLINSATDFNQDDTPISIWKQLQEKKNAAEQIVNTEDISSLNQACAQLKEIIELTQQGNDILLQLTNVLETAYSEMETYSDYNGLTAFETSLYTIQEIFADENAGIPEYEKAIADVEKATHIFYLSGFENATIQNPINANWLITNPDFEQKEAGWENPWAFNTSTSYVGFDNLFTEKWVASSTAGGLGDFKFSQTLHDIPNGLYILSAYMIATLQNDPSAKVTGTYLIGNNAATEAATENGIPQLFSTEIIVTNHTLTIGAETRNTNANWVAIDNISLSYVGVDATSFKENLNKQIEIAENLLADSPEKIMAVEKANANSVIETSKAAHSVEEISAAYTELTIAIDSMRSSISAYDALYPILVLAQELSESTDYEEVDMATYKAILYEQENVLTAETTRASDLVTIKTNLEKAMHSLRVTVLKAATLTNGIDATWLIANPNFDANNINGWTSPVSPTAVNQTEVEFFQKTCDFHQILKDIPCGIYELSVQGFQRTAPNDSAKAYHAGTEVITAHLCANNDSTQLKSLYSESQESLSGVSGLLNGYPNGMQGAQEAFTAGLYKGASLRTGVNDFTLKLGIRNYTANAGGWVCFDSFKLTYFGNEGGLDVKEIDKKAAPLVAYVENGTIKVVNAETFTIKTLEGIIISSEEQLISGVYIVSANGQNVKIQIP